MATPRTLKVSSSGCRLKCSFASVGKHLYARHSSTSALPRHSWSLHPSSTNVANDEVAQLAASHRQPLTLADLLK